MERSRQPSGVTGAGGRRRWSDGLWRFWVSLVSWRSWFSGLTAHHEGRSDHLYVVEVDPASGRRRWCVVDDDAEFEALASGEVGFGPASPAGQGFDRDGFDLVEDAVAWCTARAATVVVCTLGLALYVAGSRPAHWPPKRPAGTWPPTLGERQTIESEYWAAVSEANAWRTYVDARLAWMAEHFPGRQRSPFYSCSIALPGRSDVLTFEELDRDGRICGALGPGETMAFGEPAEVLATAAETTVDDPWVRAVLAALDKERAGPAKARRAVVDERPATGGPFS